MAKIAKKKGLIKTIKKKIKSDITKSLFQKYNIKDCCVVLNRIVNKIVITRDIHIKLTKTSLKFDGKIVKPSSSDASSVTFQLKFNPEINELITQHCTVVDKRKQTIVKANKPKSLASEAEDIWCRLKRQHNQKKVELQVDQFVLAKMRSYVPWPSNSIILTKWKESSSFFFRYKQYWKR